MEMNLDSPAPTNATAYRAIAWIGLAAATVVLVAFRLHAFDLPLETDECNYIYIGSRLLAGDSLYVDVWDHQPFGVFVLFAGVIGLFGDAPEVFRWMTTAFSLASLLLIFAILRRVSSVGAAVSGAMLFALVSSDPGTAGEGCNREIYMNTLILAAWYLALRTPARPGWSVFGSGCALALASALKTIVAVHWVFLAVWLIVGAARGVPSQRHTRSAVLRVAWFAAGPVILWSAAFLYFAATGRWEEFIDAVFRFNMSYSDGSEGFFLRFARFFAPIRHPFVFGSALPLWLAGIGAVVWLAVDVILRRCRGGQNSSGSMDGEPADTGRVGSADPTYASAANQSRGREPADTVPNALAVLMLVVACYVAVCLPGRFWPHYYGLLIPPLVIAVSMAVGRFTAWIADVDVAQASWVRQAGAVLFFVVPVAVLVTEYRHYLSQPLFGITVTRYNSRDFWGRAQGENVRGVTDPDDEVFVFGNDAEIYYYAKRRCASRYTMITGLQSGLDGSDARRATMLAELEERPPRLIVVLFDEKPWDQWLRFLERHYGEAVGVDYHDQKRQPIMLVFARKDRPIDPIDWDWDRSKVGGWPLGERR